MFTKCISSIHPMRAELVKKALMEAIDSTNKMYSGISIVCIGTDMSTGDSLGPLVGSKINGLGNVKIYGHLYSTVQGKNLRSVVSTIPSTDLVIAIDSSVTDDPMDIGSIYVRTGAIKPGSGVNKQDMPLVGDISITGVVNVGTFMTTLILQMTPLSRVMTLADTISKGIIDLFSQWEYIGSPVFNGRFENDI